MDKTKKYYTYQLISSIDYQIIYVGKGSNNRCYSHIKIAVGKSKAKDKNPKLYNKINKILKSGYIIVIKVYETNIEVDALNMEKMIISNIGLENLCNLTLGGKGTSYPNGFTEQHKLNISIAAKNRLRVKIYTNEEKNNMSVIMKEMYKSGKRVPYFKDKKHTTETKQKMSKSHINKEFTESHRNNLSKSLTGRILSENHISNIKKSKQNQEYTFQFLKYDECKIWIKENYPNTKTSRDWDIIKNELPNFIPKSPYWIYQKSNHYNGWISWPDFLNNK